MKDRRCLEITVIGVKCWIVGLQQLAELPPSLSTHEGFQLDTIPCCITMHLQYSSIQAPVLMWHDVFGIHVVTQTKTTD